MPSTVTQPEETTIEESAAAHVAAVDAVPLRQLGGKLAGRSLAGQVFLLSVWPFLQQLMAWMVGAVDTAVAGRLSVQAASALGVAAYFGWFLSLMTTAVGTGSAAVISRSVGAGRRTRANAGLGQAMLIAVGWGLFVGVVIYALAPFIAQLAGLRGVSAQGAIDYIRILAIASPLAGVLYAGGACLTGSGDTRTPFLIMVLVNIVNTIATLLLALEPWSFRGVPIPGVGWGIAGIAWGTAIATAVGALWTLTALRRGSDAGGVHVRLRGRWLRPRFSMIARIVRIGAPSLGEGFGHWLGNWIVLMIVGKIALRIGDESLWGAHIVAIRIEAISFLPALAMATAAGTLAGQYLGAGDARRARQAVALCWGFSAGLMLLLGASFIAFAEPWARLMTDQPELLEHAPDLLRICGWVQVFFGTALVLSGAMRGAGDTRRPMISTLLLTWGVRLPLVWVIGVYFEQGLAGVWIALCFELLLRGIVFAVLFLRGKWAVVGA